ncbi:hypothetical protein SCHIN_v1c01720 [Spiroplasma chinense]|uniref:Transmembrane protein n=1 Tax=Spiroplasma chinense TaxID=216932 RepID=A0A5B9Y2U6_9MOLU|nr:hypothetical protein [Spiroplasma chinense]QEH61370.1 hypothetical protein SCHIN_v1c01720 [Spiroplasma chinense]
MKSKVSFKAIFTSSLIAILLIHLIFVSVKASNIVTYPHLLDLAFSPLVELIFMVFTLTFLMVLFSRLMFEMEFSLITVNYSKKLQFRKNVLSELILTLAFFVPFVVASILKMFNEAEMKEAEELFVSVIALASVFITFAFICFFLLIIYTYKFKKSKFDEVCEQINYGLHEIIAQTDFLEVIDFCFETKHDIQNNSTRNILVSRGATVELEINCTKAEYWSDLKKGTVPPNFL